MPESAAAPVVIDTNIVLDLFVFADPVALEWQQRLLARRQVWLATSAMRDEFQRVLGYRQIQPWLERHGRSAQQAMRHFDQYASLVASAPRALVVCKDPDDQKFIDLALAHRAVLLSKDRAVLRLTRRLAAMGVTVVSAMPAPA